MTGSDPAMAGSDPVADSDPAVTDSDPAVTDSDPAVTGSDTSGSDTIGSKTSDLTGSKTTSLNTIGSLSREVESGIAKLKISSESDAVNLGGVDLGVATAIGLGVLAVPNLERDSLDTIEYSYISTASISHNLHQMKLCERQKFAK